MSRLTKHSLSLRPLSFTGLSWFLGIVGFFACIALIVEFGTPKNLSDLAALATAVTGLLTVATLLLTLYTVNLQRKDIEAQRSEFLKASRAQIRSMHSELLLQAIDDPDLLFVWEPNAADDPKWFKQSVYVNQILSHWETLLEMGEITPERLELLLNTHIPKPAFKRFWSEARDIRARTAEMNDSSDKLFYKLADKVYQRSATSK